MTAEDIRRTIARIAHEIIEHNKDVSQLLLVGLHTRGVPLARRLAENIELYEKSKPAVGSLDFSLYRDDIDNSVVKKVQRTDIPTDINDKSVVLVDDVLFTGRSVRAAMDALITSVDRALSSWPSSSTGVTARCPSAPTMSVKISPPPATKKSRCALKKPTDAMR